MATIFAKISLDSSDLQNGLARAKKRMDGFKAAAMKVGGALGIAFGGRAIIGGLSKFADELDRTAKLARRLGMDAETVQRLGQAAELSGSSLEEITNAMTRLVRKSSDLQNTGLAKAFEELGINQEKFISLKPDEQIKRLADAFAGAEDRATAFRHLFTLLEDDAKKLIPLFEEGGEGIQKMMDGAAVATNEAAAAAENLNDQWAIMKNTAVPLLGELLVGINKLTNGYKTLFETMGGADFQESALKNFFGMDVDAMRKARQERVERETQERIKARDRRMFASWGSSDPTAMPSQTRANRELLGRLFRVRSRMFGGGTQMVGGNPGQLAAALAAGMQSPTAIGGRSPAQAAADSMAAIGGGGNVNSAAMRTARIQQDQLSELKEVASNTEAIAQRQGEIAMR